MVTSADRVARASRLLAAVAGLWLSWLLFDWLGDPWDHCDYPDECLGSWFGRTFMLVQFAWILSVAVAGVGVVAATRARWPRRDIALLAVAGAALFASLVTTPMHWGGPDMTTEQIEGNWYVWGSHGDGYERLGLLAGAASLMLGWRAASGHPRPRQARPTARRDRPPNASHPEAPQDAPR